MITCDESMIYELQMEWFVDHPVFETDDNTDEQINLALQSFQITLEDGIFVDSNGEAVSKHRLRKAVYSGMCCATPEELS